MTKILVGIILGLGIGVACRWFDIPVPSPPKLTGALLVVAMTVGYMLTDKVIAAKFTARGLSSTQGLCGGPTGELVARAVSSAPAQGKRNQ